MTFEQFRGNVDYDLVGVPPPESFDGLPPDQHPFSLFPDARSVIVVGRRLGRGAFRGMEEGTQWTVPGRWITQFDALVRWIERQGWECVPYNPGDVNENLPAQPQSGAVLSQPGVLPAQPPPVVAPQPTTPGQVGQPGPASSAAPSSWRP